MTRSKLFSQDDTSDDGSGVPQWMHRFGAALWKLFRILPQIQGTGSATAETWWNECCPLTIIVQLNLMIYCHTPVSRDPEPIRSEIPVAPKVVDDAAILVEASQTPKGMHLNTHALALDFKDIWVPINWLVSELMSSSWLVDVWVFR